MVQNSPKYDDVICEQPLTIEENVCAICAYYSLVCIVDVLHEHSSMIVKHFK